MKEKSLNKTENEDVIWNSAVNFINSKLSSIKKRARQFLPYSSLEPEDFIQEAYICAFTAIVSCSFKKEGVCKKCSPEKCETYPHIFWGVIKAGFAKIADIPSYKKLLGEEHFDTPCNFISLANDAELPIPIPSVAPSPLQRLLEQEKRSVNINLANMQNHEILKALRKMTQQQAEAWEYAIGLKGDGRRMSHREIANHMKISRQRVGALLKEGMEKAVMLTLF